MKIAVLLSSYNGETYLEEQIESVLQQKIDGQVDLFVRDDGSTDDTTTILNGYQKKGMLEWYTGSNKGPAHSFIDLILHVKNRGYDYYAFCDQDDYWMPEKLQSAVEKIRTTEGPAMYVGNAQLVDEKLAFMGRNVYREDPKLDFYTVSCAGGLLGCTMVFNARLAEIVQRNPPVGKIVMHDFYIALLCAAVGGKLVYDARPFMKYRQHGNNVVGVAHGVMGTIKSRIDDIATPAKVGIAEQAETLLQNPMIKGTKRRWLVNVARYNCSVRGRIALAASSKTSYINKNNALKLRISILLGNR